MGAQLVEAGPKGRVLVFADLFGPRVLQVGDDAEELIGDAVAGGGPSHDDGPSVGRVGVGAYEPKLDEFADALADGLLGDPPAGRELGRACPVLGEQGDRPQPRGPGRPRQRPQLVGRFESGAATEHDLDPTARDQLLARRALTCRFGLDLGLRVADRPR